jgi:hypothetical protein
MEYGLKLAAKIIHKICGGKISNLIISGENNFKNNQIKFNSDKFEKIIGSKISSAEIKKIRITGTSRAGYKANFQTKGMTGVDNYFLNIEAAIAVGEIKSFGMTSGEALAALKKAIDKLDLGVISQEEYDKIKAELTHRSYSRNQAKCHNFVIKNLMPSPTEPNKGQIMRAAGNDLLHLRHDNFLCFNRMQACFVPKSYRPHDPKNDQYPQP